MSVQWKGTVYRHGRSLLPPEAEGCMGIAGGERRTRLGAAAGAASGAINCNHRDLNIRVDVVRWHSHPFMPEAGARHSAL